VYVAEDPDTGNPILRKQIAARIDERLEGCGDNPVETADRANYLLVACIEYFGVDTREWVTTTIKRDDPRILGIAEEPPEETNRR
jgi:hypothetical protein